MRVPSGIVALAVSGLLLAACGGDDDDDADADGAASSSTSSTPATTTTAAPAASHTVVSGDTLSSIADRYGTTVAVLVELNQLADPNVLAVGQVLQLPPSTSAP